ncbi:hypothetical protein ACTMTF_19970 [Nonomuraea sp. ZG12]|uniref:hypothetical protein n=1 Tax=Nonomuraea sp. ZG12 TaxID=3452207 RepID=UPI003F8880BC
MSDEPGLSAEDMIGRLDGALSPWRRAGGVVALIAGAAGAIFVALLWATEPGPLPGHTQVAFALLAGFCLAWAGYGGWVIRRRAPLFALDRVIAGWLAVAVSTVTTVLIVVVAVGRDAGVIPAVVGGATFIVVSAVVTVRAHVVRAALLRRRRELTGEG